MYVAAELADFYRKNFSEPNRHAHAKAWIDAHPENLAVVLMATMHATIEDISMAPLRLPETMALDMMKLGTGAAEGSKLGIAEDVLRALSVVPVGRVVQGANNFLRPFLGRLLQGVSNLVHWRQVRGGLCVPISIAQALQRTGTRLVVPLKEIAKAAGKPMPDITKSGLKLPEIRAALQGLKVDYKEIPGGFIKNWNDLVAHTARTEGAVLVLLRLTRQGANKGHGILVSNTAQGVKIFDRYGVFSSLDELSQHYRLFQAGSKPFELATGFPQFVMRNWAMDASLAAEMNAFGPLAAVVVRAAAMITLNPSVPVARLQADFDAFLADRNAGPLPPNPSPGAPPASDVMAMHYVPASGVMLSKVSMSYYGTFHMWPLIWDANRELIGPNPNRVPKDIYLRIMKPHVYGAAQIAEAKRRSLNWKAFN